MFIKIILLLRTEDGLTPPSAPLFTYKSNPIPIVAFMKRVENKTLLVIIPDRLSDLVKKGEIIERYYNPGNLFDEVHILMANDDKPDLVALQKIVGNAKLHLHNLLSGNELFLKTLGWRPTLLRWWAKQGIAMARVIKPQLIRCHGNHLNGYLAAQIKNELGVPYVISIHTNPDENRKYWSAGWKEKSLYYAAKSIEEISIQHADFIIPVYESIRSYLKHLKHGKVKVLYNVANSERLKKKVSYGLHSPVRVISVGRLIPGKCPDNLIRAMKGLDAELTIVGNGPLRTYLHQVARDTGVTNQVNFIPSLSNDELCLSLPDYDIFTTHCEYHGIPKAILEASLTGLPIILNRIKSRPVPELRGEWIMLVDNSSQGYRRALRQLIVDHDFRECLGRKAYAHALEHWEPSKMESKYVEIYKRVIAEDGIKR